MRADFNMAPNIPPSATAEVLPPVKETNLRLFQAAPNPNQFVIGYKRCTREGTTTFECAASNKDTVLEETRYDDVITELRVKLAGKLELLFTPKLVESYRSVKRLEINCPVPSVMVFEWMSRLPSLRKVRIGSGFFSVCQEMATVKIEPLPHVRVLDLTCDKGKYEHLSKTHQTRIQNKLETFLSLVAKYFTGLNEVHISVPFGKALGEFLKKRPDIRDKGTRSDEYSHGVERFVAYPPKNVSPLLSSQQNCTAVGPIPAPPLARNNLNSTKRPAPKQGSPPNSILKRSKVQPVEPILIPIVIDLEPDVAEDVPAPKPRGEHSILFVAFLGTTIYTAWCSIHPSRPKKSSWFAIPLALKLNAANSEENWSNGIYRVLPNRSLNHI